MGLCGLARKVAGRDKEREIKNEGMLMRSRDRGEGGMERERGRERHWHSVRLWIKKGRERMERTGGGESKRISG